VVTVCNLIDVARPNESCRDHLIIGNGNVVGNGTYELGVNVLESTSAAVVVELFVTVQKLFIYMKLCQQ
jgi:hypothetical protein